MKYEGPDIIEQQHEEDWGRRRDNMRHEVQLPAVLTDKLGLVVPCVIEDISASGVALSIQSFVPEPGRDPLQQNTVAVLEFAPDPSAPDSRVETEVQVMWCTPVALGVRFVQPTQALRAALRKVAEDAVSERLYDLKSQRGVLAPDQRQMLLACRKTLQQRLPNLIWILRAELVNHLRLAASESSDKAQTRAALDDAALIEDKAAGIARAIEYEMLKGFTSSADLDETQELTLMQINSSAANSGSADKSMGITDQTTQAREARLSAIAHTVHERYKTKYFELDVRLANVLGHKLDAKSNALRPDNLCGIVWRAIVGCCDSDRVQLALKQVILGDIAPLIGELYKAINDTLDESGAQRIFDVRQN